MDSKDFACLLTVLGISVILPITMVFLSLRKKIESERNRKEIILAALEKNANINIEELVKKMNAPEKLIKERLLKKLQTGIITLLIGLILIIYIIITSYNGGANPNTITILGIAGGGLLSAGISLLCTYGYGKKMLAKEMEVEEQNLRESSGRA